MILLSLIFFLIAVYAIFSISQLYNIVQRGNAPLMTTGKKTIRRIMNEIHIQNHDTIYELGCGRAVFLEEIEKDFPKTTCIGIENLFSVFLFTKIKFFLKRSALSILKKDIFSIDLKKATIIYCYLNNKTMDRLGKKIKQECASGTQIISRSFPLHMFVPEKIIEIQKKKIYFYTV